MLSAARSFTALIARSLVGLRRASGAMLVLIALPAALVRTTGWPWPDHLPTVDDVRQFADQPMTPQSMTLFVTVPLWIIWAVAAWSAVVVTAAAVRVGARRARWWSSHAAPWSVTLGSAAGLDRRLLRVPSATEGLSAVVLGTVAVSTAAASAAAVVAAPAVPAHAAGDDGPTIDAASAVPLPLTSAGTAQFAYQKSAAGVSRPDLVAVPRTPHAYSGTAAGVAPSGDTVLAPPGPSLGYQVADGDWLGEIADRYLGDFDRYPEIAALNRDLIPHDDGPDGADLIHPGERFRLPADAYDRGPRPHAAGTAVTADDGAAPAIPGPATPPPPAPGSSTAPSTGPSVGASAAPSIAPSAQSSTASRPGTAPSSSPTQTAAPSAGACDPAVISDPDGVVSEPGPDCPPTAAPSDTPSAAADGGRADGEGIQVPGGWVTMPLAAALVAAATVVWRRRQRRRPRAVRPRNDRAGSGDTTVRHAERAVTGITPAPADATDRPQHRRSGARTGGREVAAAHRTGAQSPSTTSSGEAFPRVLRHLRTAVPPQPAQAVPPTVAEYNRTPPPQRQPLPPVGPSGADLAGLTVFLDPSGLGVTGPGAHDALRAAMIAVLSTGGPHDPDADGILVTTTTVTTALFGPTHLTGSVAGGPAAGPDRSDAPSDPASASAAASTHQHVDAAPYPNPRFRVCSTTLEAVTATEEMIIERRRLLDEHDSADPATLHATQALYPPMPPVLLLIDPPAAAHRARLHATAQLGHPLHVHAVLLGAWPAGPTITVGADGRVSGHVSGHEPGEPGEHRVAVLDLATAGDLLPVILEAHDHRSHTPEAPERTAGPPSASDTVLDVADGDPAGQTSAAANRAATGDAGAETSRPAGSDPASDGSNGPNGDQVNAADAAPSVGGHAARQESTNAPQDGDSADVDAPARGVAATVDAASAISVPVPSDVAAQAAGGAVPAPDADHAADGSPARQDAADPSGRRHHHDGDRSRASGHAPGHTSGGETQREPGRQPYRAPRPVRVRVFGHPRVEQPEDVEAGGIRRYARELLVYLAIHHRGADLPQIMEAFWPHATVRRASQRLSTEAADLRRHIRIARGDRTVEPVINSGGHYRLNPAIVTVDLWEFNTAIHAAATATTRADRIAALDRAVTIHVGDVGDGIDNEWIDPFREHYRVTAVTAYLDLAHALADTGVRRDVERAAAVAEAALTLDPYSDDTAQQAMRIAARCGNPAAVPDLLTALRTALHDIGEEPSPATVTLAADLCPAPTGPTPPAARDKS